MKCLLLVLITYSLFEQYTLNRNNNKLKVVREQLKSHKIRKPFEHFRNFEEIEQLLKKWAKKHKNLIKLDVIGHTYEKRNIYSLSIEDKSDRKSKPGVIIECGIHPREWISPAICLYLVNDALTKPQSLFSRLLASFNIYMLPMMNPDGYVYTWTTDRLWRKNRSPQDNNCVGVDLNRNFDIDFCEHGSDKESCSQIYCGPKAFSELESRAFRDFAKKIKKQKNLQHTFHIHSYGQQITYPYGYAAAAEAPNMKDLERIVQMVAYRMKKYRGKEYKAGQSGKIIYEASGGSDDWSMKEFKLDSVYCIENLDTGKYGFMVSNNQIRNASEECCQIITDILRYSIQE